MPGEAGAGGPPGARIPLLALVLAAVAVAAVVSAFRNLYDTDSYLHLAVAREYGEGHLRGGLPWVRFSALGDGFGDKELLFHLLLVPVALAGGGLLPALGALAVVNGVVAAAIARLAAPAVGRWAVVLPVVLAASSVDFAARLLRLRPEGLSLALLLLAVPLAAERRHRALGALAAVYALTHTSFPLLVVLCAAWMLHDGLRHRRWDYDLVAYPLLGAVAATLLHPQFPANVRVFVLQNVVRYRLDLPDAGAEFLRPPLRDALELNAAWILLLLVLWRSRAPGEPPSPGPRPAGHLAVAAALSLGLFALLPRFAVYLVPFATLAVLQHARERGLRIGGRTRVAFGRTVPLPVALFVLVGPAVARNVLVLRYNLEVQGVFLAGRAEDARAFSGRLPAGARVAAPWGDAQLYAWWAPQARYLNVLDPVFMAAWAPRAYRAQADLFSGREPDAPLAAATVLDSEYVALTRRPASVALRFPRDPRVQERHLGYETLFALVPGRNGDFVLDWRVSPSGVLPADPAEAAAWPPYPAAPLPLGRAFEGFVDGRRLGAPRCLVLAREVGPRDPGVYEFAPYGTSTLLVDGRPVVQVPEASRAVLGRGATVALDAAAGRLLSVATCPADGIAGFYLLRRPAGRRHEKIGG